MDKRKMVGPLSLAAGLGLTLGLWSATPTLAGPPLDLVTGEQSVPALKEDGLLYMQWGFQSLAIDSFRGAIALEDKANTLPSQRDPDVPFNLGLLYLNEGELKQARRAFERSVEADPTNFKAQYQLGLVELQMGDEQSAWQRLRLLETAAAEDPQMQEHLSLLLASIDPLPVATPAPISAPANSAPVETPDETALLETEPDTEIESPAADPEDLVESTEETSTLASESPVGAADLYSDEITGVVEFEATESESLETEANALESPEESEEEPAGLSRFRDRED